MNENEKAYIAGLLDGKDIFQFGKCKDNRRVNKNYVRYRLYLRFDTTNKNVVNIIKHYYKCSIKNYQGKSFRITIYGYDIQSVLNDILTYLRHNKSRAEIIKQVLDIKWAELRIREVFKDKENKKFGEQCKPSADFYESQENLWGQFQEIQNKKSTEFPEPKIISTEFDYYYIAGFTDNFCNLVPSINTWSRNGKEYRIPLFSHSFNVSSSEGLSLIKYYFGGTLHKNYLKSNYIKFSPEESIEFIEMIYPYLKIKQDGCKFFLRLLKSRFIDKEKYIKLFKNWEKVKQFHKNELEFITCTCCNMLKRKTDYYVTKKTVNNYLSYECIDCQKEKASLYNEEHRDYLRQKVAEYKKNYPEKVKESRRKCIKYRLKKNIVRRMKEFLKSQVSGKSELVGCDSKFLKEYLEDRFEPGISWENYGNGEGKWEIDHIKPLAYFNLEIESERKIAGHYTNLRPLWSKDNGEKSDTLPNGKRGRDCRKLIETDPLFTCPLEKF